MYFIGVGSNSILGGPNILYTMIAVIRAACMNIYKVSRVKYWGAKASAPHFLRLYVLYRKQFPESNGMYAQLPFSKLI